MSINLETTLRSTISHAALSASVALSWTAVADTASAQQSQPASQSGRNVQLDTINVEGQPGGDAETAYSVPTASSPKQTAPLVDTPQTVTVVPKQIIKERNARDLTEVLRNTPGITFDGGENGFGTSMTNFKLRGFDTSGNVFIDGSRDNGTYSRDTFNVERVEIFKGPAADNGRGGAGGYVNIVTKSPSLQNFIAGDVGFGFDEYRSEPRKRTTVDINRMVGGNMAFRLNGMWEDGGVAGRNIAENRGWGFAPSLAFGLGTDLRATFSYEHLTRRDLPDWGVPAALIKGMMRFDPLGDSVPRDNFYGLRSDFDNVDGDSALARFEYDFSKNVTISNQTRWARVDRTSRFTTIGGNPFGNPQPPLTRGSTVATTTLFYDRTNTTLTNLTNLSAELYTGAFRHDLSAGLELSREESSAGRFAAAVPSPGNPGLFDPDPDRVGGAPFNRTQSADIKVNTVAAYLYDTMHLSQRWQITGGLRVEHYKATINDSNPVPVGLGNFSMTDTTLGGKIGVVYKPADNGSVYASVGVSHQPPGSYLSTSDISRTGDNAFPNLRPDADPVRSINYEVGTKWDFFNGRLSATAALFQTDKRVPITGCIPAPGPAPSTCAVPGSVTLAGYGHQIARGVEFGIAGNITDQWKVFGGLLLMKTERRHSAWLDRMRMAAQPGDYPLGFRNGTNGDELAFTPRVSANLWMTYRMLQFPLTVGGGVQHVGSSWAGRPDDAERIIPNGVFGKLPAYTVFHLMAAYELRKDVDVRFNVDNVADHKYAVSSNWPAQRVMLGAPRTYRVAASFRF